MKRSEFLNRKSDLLNRMRALFTMDREKLLAEVPKVCGFKVSEQATDNEIREVLMKFAIYTAFE